MSTNSLELEPKNEEKWVDPVVRKEYMSWKKSPSLDKSASPFLCRLYTEDLMPCLTFPNQELTDKVIRAVETNSLSMSPIILPKDGPSTSSAAEDNCELPKHCALFDAPFICQFLLVFEDESNFQISSLARNRIAAACECIGYLRYICEGLVKAHHNEVYWEIVKRRKKLILAKLGFSPDED